MITDIFFTHYENIIQDLFRDKKRIFAQKEEALLSENFPVSILCTVLFHALSCILLFQVFCLLPYGMCVCSPALPPFRAV